MNNLIDNNKKCIDTYRNELSETKKSLYRLKNLYKTIEVCLNSILKNKLDNMDYNSFKSEYSFALYPYLIPSNLPRFELASAHAII